MSDSPSSNSIRLRARDINEALGKVPPQALDMEESVLSAMLIERSAFEKCVAYLKPSHFYKETHRLVYQAMVSLYADGNPIDMRTVVHQLRRTGHIEIIGGAHFIAELSSKMSSAANIDYHARIVVEMAMKRELISLASRIHHQAYEDDTDVFKLIETLEIDLLHLNNKETTAQTSIEQIWKDTIVSERPPVRVPIVSLQGRPLFTESNHSLIIGKKKSRKSLFIVQLICLGIEQGLDPMEILPFDTEQEREDVWEMKQKVKKVTGKDITFFSLRGKSYVERRQIIDKTIKHWKEKRGKYPKWVIIDGIRDLMSNIIDPDESTDLMTWIERLTTDYHLHVTDVLHLNKTNNEARGHIGTELVNKSEMNIELVYDEKTTMTEVRCESARRHPFTTFMFQHSPEGLPEIVGEKLGEQTIHDDDARNNLHLMFEDGPLKYRELMEEVKNYFSVGENKAKRLITDFRKKAWIVRNGPARSPDAIYKLMIGKDPEPTTGELFQSNGQHIETPPLPDDMPMWVNGEEI